MKGKIRIWLATAAFMVIAGMAVISVVMTVNGWDFGKLGTFDYVTETYEVTEEFNAVVIDANTADITFVPSEDGSCRVICTDAEYMEYPVKVENGVLTVAAKDDREWYEYIGISFGNSCITVYMPAGEYDSLKIDVSTGDMAIPDDFAFGEVEITASTGDVNFCADAAGSLSIKTSTGDICVEGSSAGSMTLYVSTGGVTVTDAVCHGDMYLRVTTGDTVLTDVTFANLVSEGTTGDLSMKNAMASGSISIKRDTGDIRFEDCDAAELHITTDTGYVEGTLLSDKIFIVDTGTGDVKVPNTTEGGVCEINTSTGDVDISVK